MNPHNCPALLNSAVNTHELQLIFTCTANKIMEDGRDNIGFFIINM